VGRADIGGATERLNLSLPFGVSLFRCEKGVKEKYIVEYPYPLVHEVKEVPSTAMAKKVDKKISGKHGPGDFFEDIILWLSRQTVVEVSRESQMTIREIY
jgi:hypothetical protein